MANRYNHCRTMFEYVDQYPQSVPGSIANTDEVQSWPCPPYDTQKEVTCGMHKVNTNHSFVLKMTNNCVQLVLDIV